MEKVLYIVKIANTKYSLGHTKSLYIKTPSMAIRTFMIKSILAHLQTNHHKFNHNTDIQLRVRAKASGLLTY